MSFIGNIAAAQTAKTIGKYNERLAYEQAAYDRKKAAVQQKVFDTIERPRFVKQQEKAYSNFFVNALRTGAEFRDDYNSDGFIFIKQDQPLPCSVLAIYPTVVTSDG